MLIIYILLALLITLPITGAAYYSSKNLSGALLCFLIALPAWFLGRWLSIVGGPVIGIMLGILIAGVWCVPDACK